jgi:hypothetical protein
VKSNGVGYLKLESQRVLSKVCRLRWLPATRVCWEACIRYGRAKVQKQLLHPQHAYRFVCCVWCCCTYCEECGRVYSPGYTGSAKQHLSTYPAHVLRPVPCLIAVPERCSMTQQSSRNRVSYLQSIVL